MKRPTKIAIAIVGLLLVALVCIALVTPTFFARARRAWKNKAIPEITSRVANQRWLAAEVEKVKAQAKADPFYGWLSEDLILMENGEWLVYRSHCSKEPPHYVEDIFLAKGSDGKWYYSTYHFCVGMYNLRSEMPIPSLAEFVRGFSVREFDGHSDECLKQTWDHSPALINHTPVQQPSQ